MEVFLVRIQVTDLPSPSSDSTSTSTTRSWDPVAQLFVGQGAMSHLLIQMAQEMNRRASEQGGGDPSQSSGQGSASGSRKEMKDQKWIPSMPIASWKNWTSRGKELSGFKSWLEQFSGWLCLSHDAYGPEMSHQLSRSDSILRDHDQSMRSKRLFHLLQQNFTGHSKIENGSMVPSL